MKYIFSILFLLFFFLPHHAQENETDYLVIDSIEIDGNRVTKRKIILRELSFAVGDTLRKLQIMNEIVKSKNNLNNTLLFNFVYMDFMPAGDKATVRISVVERWYIWPIPIFEIGERNLPAWLRDPEFEKLNYGLQLNWNNFRGRRELLQFKARLGYKEQYALAYNKPNIDKDQQHGIRILLNGFRQQEEIYQTVNDKPVFFKDHGEHLSTSISPSIGYTYRPEFYLKHSFSVGFTSNYFAEDSLRMQYQGKSTNAPLEFFSASYSLEYDNRDYVIYPLSGVFFRLDLQRRGLGIMPSFNYGKNFVTLTATRHNQIIKRLYYENALKIRITKDEDLPYIFRQALGYTTNIRGFEYYIVDGNSYFASANNLKFNIMPKKAFVLKPIPWEQFNQIHLSLYTNLFFDFGYVQGRHYNINGNNLPNQFLWSTGIGFDLLSYYDQVYRLEFTLNSLGQTGIYLHLETPFRRW